MSCIYALEDKPGSAMKLISKALARHARCLECESLYNVDFFECILCYNAGLYLQSMQGYARAIDAFLCCLPVLKGIARLWLRMGQCLLAIWEPPFVNNNVNKHCLFDNDEINSHSNDSWLQSNSLMKQIIEANSTKRGNLYILPTPQKMSLLNIRKREHVRYFSTFVGSNRYNGNETQKQNKNSKDTRQQQQRNLKSKNAHATQQDESKNEVENGNEKEKKNRINSINDNNGDKSNEFLKGLNHLGMGLEFENRNDMEFGYPYVEYCNKQNLNERKKQARWNKRKHKQTEMTKKIGVIIEQIDKLRKDYINGNEMNNNNNNNSGKNENENENENKESNEMKSNFNNKSQNEAKMTSKKTNEINDNEKKRKENRVEKEMESIQNGGSNSSSSTDKKEKGKEKEKKSKNKTKKTSKKSDASMINGILGKKKSKEEKESYDSGAEEEEDIDVDVNTKRKDKAANNGSKMNGNSLDEKKRQKTKNGSKRSKNGTNSNSSSFDIETNGNKYDSRLLQKQRSKEQMRTKEHREEYNRQIRELHDTELAIEWLKNGLSLYLKSKKKSEMNNSKNNKSNIVKFDDWQGLESVHLHLAYAYLKLKAWEYALMHCEATIKWNNIILNGNRSDSSENNDSNDKNNNSNKAKANKSDSKHDDANKERESNHITFEAHMYAAECLIHMNRYVDALSHLDPHNFPHMRQATTKMLDEKMSQIESRIGNNNNNNNNNNNKKETKDSNNNNNNNNNNSKSSNITEKSIQNEKNLSEKELLFLYCNLATYFILRNEFFKSHKYIFRAIELNNNFYPALRLLVYLHIKFNSIEDAINILKHRRPIAVAKLIQRGLNSNS